LDDINGADLWEDQEAAKKITGQFANRIFVQPLQNGLVRINFGEVLDTEASYHTAIVVTAEQAIGFAQVIYNISTAENAAFRAIQAARAAMEAASAAASDPNATRHI
jgi:hypothetical protein